ncbi:hypothetical protein [Caproicibacter fermentans]|uniref:Uncharacterized protein n=1 Tax=Caproicibacter fermentans TaxID=2576756 RepID=A0A7G8TD80_9FIRM|nr:hypothetical protein [Caproicibacter fermentans]QNK41571.1 hypothetical protein HCR03_04720 [Caproicibacter fermentans]
MSQNDWSQFIQVILSLLSGGLFGTLIILSIKWINSRKSIKDLDAKIGDPGNVTLVGLLDDKIGTLDHQSLAGLIGKLDHTTLSGQNIRILNEIEICQNKIGKIYENEQVNWEQMSARFNQMEQSVAALVTFAQAMTKLQNSTLLQEEDQLKQESIRLKQQLSALQKRGGNQK